HAAHNLFKTAFIRSSRAGIMPSLFALPDRRFSSWQAMPLPEAPVKTTGMTMSVARIGPYTLPNQLILAPMAGVTDQPFRQLSRRLGAGRAVSEMVTSDVKLWHSSKSRLRLVHAGDAEPRSVQIAGSDPAMLAEAARRNVELGAQI